VVLVVEVRLAVRGVVTFPVVQELPAKETLVALGQQQMLLQAVAVVLVQLAELEQVQQRVVAVLVFNLL
jgi:hypothetical protein